MEYNSNIDVNCILNDIKIIDFKKFNTKLLLLFFSVLVVFSVSNHKMADSELSFLNDIYNITINRKVLKEIYEENQNRINMFNDIMKIKKLVYTVNIGNYDILKTINKQDGWDYFAFVDSNISEYNNTNWTLIPTLNISNNLNVSEVKKTRYFKIWII